MLQTVKNQPGRLTGVSWTHQRWLQVFGKLLGHPANRYNLTISAEYKFVWFRVAKVGTRSILAHLNEHCAPLTAEHPISVYFHPRSYREYHKFAFVRNPWDRFVSGWRNRIVEHNSFNFEEGKLAQLRDFDAFADELQNMPTVYQNLHFKPQCELIDLNHIDFIGRYETFEADLKIVFNRLNIPIRNFPHKNQSDHQLDAVYTDKTRAAVFELYRRDFEIFYPTLRADYLRSIS